MTERRRPAGLEPVDSAVGPGRQDVLLGDELQGIGDGLERAMWADAHGAHPLLDASEGFPFEPGEHQHHDGEEGEDVVRRQRHR